MKAKDTENQVVYGIIHTCVASEGKMRKMGFDIPVHPKSGAVTYKGEVIGRMDNFTGFIVHCRGALNEIKSAMPELGIWNEVR